MNRPVIRSSARAIIYKVYERCLAELEVGQILSDLNNVYKRTSDMTVAEQAFQSISVDDWKNSCQHVMKIEKDYYRRGQTLYNDIEKIVINLQDDSSSSDTSEDSQQYFDESSHQDMDEDFSGVEFLGENIIDDD